MKIKRVIETCVNYEHSYLSFSDQESMTKLITEIVQIYILECRLGKTFTMYICGHSCQGPLREAKGQFQGAGSLLPIFMWILGMPVLAESITNKLRGSLKFCVVYNAALEYIQNSLMVAQERSVQKSFMLQKIKTDTRRGCVTTDCLNWPILATEQKVRVRRDFLPMLAFI